MTGTIWAVLATAYVLTRMLTEFTANQKIVFLVVMVLGMLCHFLFFPLTELYIMSLVQQLSARGA